MKRRKINIDELIALNEEMIAFSKAGLPMAEGFRLLGQEVKGSFSTLVNDMAADLESGQSLPKVVESRKVAFPVYFPKIIASCANSNRLSVALMSISMLAKRIAELQKRTLRATVYPMVIVVMAFLLFVLSTVTWFPLMIAESESLRMDENLMSMWIKAINENVYLVSGLVGLILLGGSLLTLFFFRRWLVRSIYVRCQRAIFAEVFAISIESKLPLAESIMIAGESSGNGAIEKQCKQIAAVIEQGGVVGKFESPMPNYMGWIIRCFANGKGGTFEQRVASLKATAAFYRKRYLDKCDRVTQMAPVWFAVGVGGGVFFIWLIVSASPWFAMLKESWSNF